MARYFLHVEDNDGAVADLVGRDFADVEDAIIEGGRAAGDMFAEDLRKGDGPVSIKVRVENAENGHVAQIEIEGRVVR